MSAFTMVLSERPVSAHKGPKHRYIEALRKAALARSPIVQVAPLYARILWFHKHPTTLDVDNIAKRILDALKGIVFVDDVAVSHCLTARIDATIDYELSGSPPSELEAELLLELLDDHASRDVLYVEVGSRTGAVVNFGEVI